MAKGGSGINVEFIRLIIMKDSRTARNAPAEARTNFARVSGTDWKFSLLGQLGSSTAPRVLTTAELHRLVLEYRPSASKNTTLVTSRALVAAGALHRVSAGLFLNRRVVPAVAPLEAAGHIRAGAIISLHTVLGECGFLNNPSQVTFAVVPSSATQRPRLGATRSSGGDRFRFIGLSSRFFPHSPNDRESLLQPGRHCDVFRPEAALLQWLYLSSTRRSKLTPPPLDVDMSQLDAGLLQTFAQRWKLTAALASFVSKAGLTNVGDAEAGASVLESQKNSSDLATQSLAAKARLLARRS